MYFQEIHNRMQAVFQTAAAERSKRPNLVPEPGEGRTELEWVLFERSTMLAAVNAERAVIGLPPVDVTMVRRVERLAEGHTDYATKFPLYCAELVVGVAGKNVKVW